MAQTIAEKTQPGQRQSIEESSNVFYVLVLCCYFSMKANLFFVCFDEDT